MVPRGSLPALLAVLLALAPAAEGQGTVMTYYTVESSGCSLQVAVMSGAQATVPADEVLVILHGFPEGGYHMGHDMAAGILADGSLNWRVVMPSMRGYNRSCIYADTAQYKIDLLAADIAAVMQDSAVMAGRETKAHLLGHDWGAAVATVVAGLHPDLVKTLIIVNGPHIQGFAKLLRTDPEQQKRSSYMDFFMSAEAPVAMQADNFSRPASYFAGEPWFESQRDYFIDAWSQGCETGTCSISAGLQYYKANLRFNNNKTADGLVSEELPGDALEPMCMHVRTLLLWGLNDSTFYTDGNLESFCPYAMDRVTVVLHGDLGHFESMHDANTIGDVKTWIANDGVLVRPNPLDAVLQNFCGLPGKPASICGSAGPADGGGGEERDSGASDALLAVFIILILMGCAGAMISYVYKKRQRYQKNNFRMEHVDESGDQAGAPQSDKI